MAKRVRNIPSGRSSTILRTPASVTVAVDKIADVPDAFLCLYRNAENMLFGVFHATF